jgi:hypothetical protein
LNATRIARLECGKARESDAEREDRPKAGLYLVNGGKPGLLTDKT